MEKQIETLLLRVKLMSICSLFIAVMGLCGLAMDWYSKKQTPVSYWQLDSLSTVIDVQAAIIDRQGSQIVRLQRLYGALDTTWRIHVTGTDSLILEGMAQYRAIYWHDSVLRPRAIHPIHQSHDPQKP
jgi:hypothetical protein